MSINEHAAGQADAVHPGVHIDAGHGGPDAALPELRPAADVHRERSAASSRSSAGIISSATRAAPSTTANAQTPPPDHNLKRFLLFSGNGSLLEHRAHHRRHLGHRPGAGGAGFATAATSSSADAGNRCCGAPKRRTRSAAHARLRSGRRGRAPCAWRCGRHTKFPRSTCSRNNAGPATHPDRRRRLWERAGQEIAINLEAPIHLSRLFVPHLLKQPRPAIVNVTSGLSFTPLAAVLIYSATKAMPIPSRSRCVINSAPRRFR